MKNLIKIDDFIKLNLRIGKAENNSKEEIVLSSIGNKIVFPVFEGDIPLIPEKKAENGWKVS